VLTPILATDDPYEATAVFVNAGWSLLFQTPVTPTTRSLASRLQAPS
jgi:hypothetical protein